MELPNTRAHTREDTRTHTGEKKVEIVQKREKVKKKGRGVKGRTKGKKEKGKKR